MPGTDEHLSSVVPRRQCDAYTAPSSAYENQRVHATLVAALPTATGGVTRSRTLRRYLPYGTAVATVPCSIAIRVSLFPVPFPIPSRLVAAGQEYPLPSGCTMKRTATDAPLAATAAPASER